MSKDYHSHVTTDHDTIRKWAESRNGKPAAVEETHHGKDAGILRILFTEEADRGGLEEVSWDEFFRTFDDRNLAFLYQDATKGGGEPSRFHKFVDRDKHDEG
ncbi:MAG: hypothetical protein LDL26_08365 [Caenispirillum bisanense]|nr:hypothetical protein [Caenispirillum bisanense]MCA1973658.1 hypothetical protein [Caenispirillum sp.]